MTQVASPKLEEAFKERRTELERQACPSKVAKIDVASSDYIDSTNAYSYVPMCDSISIFEEACRKPLSEILAY